MKTLFYILSIIGGIIGTLILFLIIFVDSAPQQGAGAAIAVALVVIPYCMARAFEKLRQKPLDETLGKLLIAQAQIHRQQQNTPGSQYDLQAPIK